MTSNHVEHNPPGHGSTMFVDNDDAYNYNPVFAHGQAQYDSNWTVDHNPPSTNGIYQNATPNAVNTWAHPTSTTSQSNMNYGATSGGYYGMPNSRPPPQFRDTAAFPTHAGLSHPSSSTSMPRVAMPTLQPQGHAQQSTPTVHLSAVPLSRTQPREDAINAHVGRAKRLQIPKGTMSGNFFVVDQKALASVAGSKPLHNFVDISISQADLPITKSTIPPYVPRKSRKEILADPTLRAKVDKAPNPFKTLTKMMISNSSPATTPDTIGSSETSSSEYTDSEYESESSEEPSPLPQSRPHDALQAVRYDVIKAVWLPRNVASKPDTIRTALKEFWDVVRAIRDRWKTEMDALKKAGENKQDSQLPALKERVEKQRSAVEIALSTAVEFGHPAVMRLLSQNMPLILTMYQFLVDRVRENDYSGRAVVTICKFLLTCGLTSEALETGNLNKVFSRFTKRGSDEIKALVKQITEAAAAESKNAKPTSKPTKLEESKDGKGSETAVGVKRPRMDGANPPPAKRVAPTTASMDLGNKSTVPKRPTVPSSSSDKVASNPATKPKTPAAASSFFTSLPTAQTKTAPSTTAVASMKPKAKIGVPEKKRPVAAPGPTKPVFSFSETMANLTKAREPERTVKKEEKLPPETPEERAKRLRKEERRKLRVTWKTDAALVDVRYFSRDPSEFPGSSSNTRDVKDGKEKEGLAFKRHMDVTDIEEEDDQPLEHTFFEFTYPSLVDFSGVGEKEREINYERFGGQKKVESPERLAQEERETTTLMVTYFARSDIPPSPREPPNPYTGVPLETKMFGNPPDTVMQRMAALQPQQAPDIMNILKAIQGSQPEQPTEQSYQQPTLALQSSFQPPQPQPAAQPNSIESILAQMTGSSIAQPAPAAPQYAQYQAPAPVAQVQPPARGQESDIKSILEALNMHAQPMQQPTTAAQSFAPAATPSMSNSSAMEIMARLGVNVATIPGFAPSAVAPSSSSTQLFEHPERKRMREGDNSGSDQGPSSGKRAKWNGNRNPDKPKFIFPCRFWKDGRCKKGADCTYRHEPL